MQAKEFLGNSDVEFRSYNIFDDPEGQKVHKELGGPPVPCLVVDGQPFQLLHASQIAAILGLPMPDSDLSTIKVSYDIVTIMESWIGMLERMDFDLMKSPTRSRNRPVTFMTVNSFHPISLIPGAWEEGVFEWHTRESDARREAVLTDRDKVLSFARECLLAFQVFLLNFEDAIEKQDDPLVRTTKGEVPFSVLVQSQRSHIAVHHRQMIDFLKSHDMSVDNLLDVDAIADMTLPVDLY